VALRRACVVTEKRLHLRQPNATSRPSLADVSTRAVRLLDDGAS
jgi:hypothetical protein